MPLPVLSSDRLVIRPWTMGDASAFHEIWGDPQVVWWGAAEDLDASRTMLASVLRRSDAAGPGLGWGELLMAGEEIVGNGMLGPAPDPAGEVEIGWHLARAAWGNGYATEAARALLQHAFTTLGLERVVAQIVPDNHASRAVATRLGMEVNGTAMRDGELHDLWWADSIGE